MTNISVFNKGVTQREPSAAKDIQSVAAAIRTAPLLKRLTGDYRSREAKEEREAFKKSLPLVTFSGVFTTRKNDALVSHSGYCLLYTSDAADDLLCVYLGGRCIFKKKNKTKNTTSA